MSTAPLSKRLTIGNEFGLHARPAALIVKCVSKFDADVEIEKDGVSVSGKSIMGLLTIEGHQGSELLISAQGAQAEEVLAELEALFASNFGE